MDSRQYVIGMAGHIDHGKTALVKALTGIDTDRLKDEKARGITIDLGFAHFTRDVTIIDVPGHEKLIKNMVAGVTTIDMVLFVIAADDGIMPQTLEHLDIIQLLGIRTGIFIITKTDLADQEWNDLVEEEVRELLASRSFETAPVIRTSAASGEGIPELKLLLEKTLDQLQPRLHDGIFRLPVDRAFSKAGFGSIVTGSVISGSVRNAETVEILPEKLQARIRSMQTHEDEVGEVSAGYRAAINLAGVELENLHRGQVLVSPGYYNPVELINAHLTVIPQSRTHIKNQIRIRLHLHTTEVIGRLILMNQKEIRAGESGYVQIRLEEKVYASFGDRFIIRQFSPAITIGGGMILETNPPRFRKRHSEEILGLLEQLYSGEVENRILACFPEFLIRPLTGQQIQIKTGMSDSTLRQVLNELIKSGKLILVEPGREEAFCSDKQIEKVITALQKQVSEYHTKYPGRAGILFAELSSRLGRYFREVIIRSGVREGIRKQVFRQEGETISLQSFSSQLSDRDRTTLDRIEEIYRTAGFNPPALPEVQESLQLKEQTLREYINILREQQRLILLEEKLMLHTDYMTRLKELVRAYFARHSEMKVADLKELTGTTRKHAIPFLSYLDSDGFTRRDGDVRVPGSRISE